MATEPSWPPRPAHPKLPMLSVTLGAGRASPLVEETRRWGAGEGTLRCRAAVSSIRGATHNRDPRWYHRHPGQANPPESRARRDALILALRPLVTSQDAAVRAASWGAIPREMLQMRSRC